MKIQQKQCFIILLLLMEWHDQTDFRKINLATSWVGDVKERQGVERIVQGWLNWYKYDQWATDSWNEKENLHESNSVRLGERP